MYMEIKMTDLLEWTSQAIDVGMQMHVKSYAPDDDKIKTSEAERYLRRLGFQTVILQKWVDAGLLTGHKNGKSPNSPVWFSFADLKKIALTARLKDMCNNQDN